MTPKRRIVLHIGTEKTGSTSLQALLHANREVLARHGIAYLSTTKRAEARGLTAAVLNEDMPDDYLRFLGVDGQDARRAFREDTLAEWRAQLDRLPIDIHTVVVSSEHFHSRLRRPEELRRLADLFSSWSSEFQVVAYLRRQVDVMNSFYSTELKNGGTRTLLEASGKMCRPGNHYFNYRQVLELWGDIFGEEALCPRLFTRPTHQGDGVIEDFLSLLSVDEAALSSPGRPRLNESLTPMGQALLRGLNQLAHRAGDEGRLAEDLQALRREVVRAFAGKGATLPPEEANALQSRFDEINEELRKKWFPERQTLFAPLDKTDDRQTGRRIDLSGKQLTLVSRALNLSDALGEKANRFKGFDECAVRLRDAAVERETRDPTGAASYMKLAARIRPKGTFIAQWLETNCPPMGVAARLRQLLWR
ncbi:hypothetical protein LV476_11120 [Guyparkeria hydrothermalis]|uniref:hypothetical protein n=1 Tax=Guyparkeria hydrothermalis TaxID=923 RepID=UPI0020209241|nr:hypothetical protein [Guyparkeria hydrothermalis]MCL7745486.1 hypothetical protein [Guyparkeria hydrothermalis]